MSQTQDAVTEEKLRSQLRTDLQRIETEEYRLREGERHDEFITSMLKYIGDPDPDLRDGLIYPTFCMWIKSSSALLRRSCSGYWKCWPMSSISSLASAAAITRVYLPGPSPCW